MALQKHTALGEHAYRRRRSPDIDPKHKVVVGFDRFPNRMAHHIRTVFRIGTRKADVCLLYTSRCV